jgi:hypothetical protein
MRQGQWFIPGIPGSSTNRIDRHNITEILLKVALNTITLTLNTIFCALYTVNVSVIQADAENCYILPFQLSDESKFEELCDM